MFTSTYESYLSKMYNILKRYCHTYPNVIHKSNLSLAYVQNYDVEN